MHSSFKIARLLHFKSVRSFTQIMNDDTDVLKEKRSISSSTFLIILCNAFHSALVGSPSLTEKFPPSSWNNFQNLRRNLKTPSIPLVFQGLLCSSGPRNISYIRNVSAPYCS